MHDYQHADDIQPEVLTRKRGRHEWRFRVRDVVIMTGLGLTMSGLVGLGTLMVIELIDSLLQ